MADSGYLEQCTVIGVTEEKVLAVSPDGFAVVTLKFLPMVFLACTTQKYGYNGIAT